MDIKRKTVICEPGWEKDLFLDISSTHTDTFLPLLYQCVETRSIECFWLLSQTLPYPVGHQLRLSNVLEGISRPSCELLYATNTSHRKQETFLYEYPLKWILLPTESAQQNAVHSSITVANLSTETSLWICACASDTCHEAGLCCYLVILIESLLLPLQHLLTLALVTVI
jgi:hypothetical protein